MTEDEANTQLERFGDYLIEIPEINYVAVVEDDDYSNDNNLMDFAIEIGIDEDKVKDIKTFLLKSSKKNLIFQSPMFRSLSRHQQLKRRKDKKIVVSKGLRIVPSRKFSFQCKNLKSGKGITSDKMHMEIGTLGGIVTLESEPDSFFIISNWHVLMGNKGKLKDSIIKGNGNRKSIGELYWAVNNDYYDIALAKISCNDWILKEKLIKPMLSLDDIKLGTIVKKNGNSTGRKSNELYSKNAFVKIKGNKIFKNQILTKKLSLKGDSGSLLLEKTTNKLIGLIFAGDEYEISVANNLSYLFNEGSVPSYLYQNERLHENERQYSVKMPEIKFKNVYTKI